MKRRALFLLLCFCLSLTCPLGASEVGELLSQEDLRSLQPTYEAFLEELSDLAVERGLLLPEEKEEWMMVQLGDYLQNGGFGTIMTMYTLDLLQLARPEDTMLRLSKTLSIGTLSLTTMRGYNPLDSSQPGLILSAELRDTEGLPVESRFRWVCSQGGFLAWDAFTGTTTDVGNSLINDGRPAYWSDQPLTAGQTGSWVITIEVLSLENDLSVRGEAQLTLMPQDEGWLLDESSLQ